jgi:hypothetical protein
VRESQGQPVPRARAERPTRGDDGQDRGMPRPPVGGDVQVDVGIDAALRIGGHPATLGAGPSRTGWGRSGTIACVSPTERAELLVTLLATLPFAALGGAGIRSGRRRLHEVAQGRIPSRPRWSFSGNRPAHEHPRYELLGGIGMLTCAVVTAAVLVLVLVVY